MGNTNGPQMGNESFPIHAPLIIGHVWAITYLAIHAPFLLPIHGAILLIAHLLGIIMAHLRAFLLSLPIQGPWRVYCCTII